MVGKKNMKRSEMLKVLRDSFLYQMNVESVTTDDEMYSNILKDLEDAGMIPPRHKDYIDTLDRHPRSYEWEHEND